jgi:hypothetical protein
MVVMPAMAAMAGDGSDDGGVEGAEIFGFCRG